MTTEETFPPIIRFQADDTTAFLRAARSGNLEKVIEFLDTDLDINTANSNGLNALHLASKDGHVEIVTELLKRGAKVDAATKKGNTALHIASLAGQAEIVNILIQYGAAVNIQSQNGFTPLYMAAQENHDQVVKLLLSNGANQSLATEDGFTPLAVAMQQGHDKVVSVLLENDSKGKVRLPALHIAAKKDDCKAADLLLQNDHKPDVTSKSGFTPLHIAAHYGNEEIARLLIKRGADVNYLAKHNISPLHVAAKWGKNNMVKVLLENSAQIDAKTRDGLTPLHCAARSGHEQVITTLLEHSAPISARTKNGLAPLHMASQGDHVDAARVLLYHRAPVDEVTIDYLTSLHVAAHCGHVRVAKLLLDRKADPNARALNGFTPLHIACKKNRIKVVELLLKHGASIESTTESGLTPLHVASFMGCMNIVIFLLQHEANPDVPTVRGETPLHLAARANQTDIIRILLRNGAKVDARAREQQTPLHIASRLGNIDIVMLLLQHGAAVDTTTKDMYTALHIAAKEGQEEVATILVENNASLKATTKNGFTPLHIAAKYGNMSVAKILLQRDCNLDVQGKNDITPLQLACHYDHPNVANLLLEKGASPHLASQNGHTPLHIAARKNQMDIASTLLENGANANAESKAGFTPLHLSAQKGHYDMTNLLIEHGADPNHKSKNGLTALHLCAQEDFIKVASILVKNGANVESETETGYRPIHIAAHFGNLSMIRFLLKHNASIDVKTNQNYTPLHQAAQQGHAHIVTALLEGNASHKARTNDGLTALNIAQKLGYISVMEVLKGLSYDTLAPDNKNWDEKYKVIAPESLQETSFMSDSDDEGGSDALISEQPYRYLTADLMKSLRDDSLPIDVTRDDPVHRQVTKEEKQEFTQSNNYCLAENFDTDGFNLGFLVSFLVDARGGAMKGCRHSGVRIIVPPRRATMPIRVTCRLIKPNKIANPPPLMEGEALATRIIEMGPIRATFLGPVLLDIPHFASIRGKEREIIILRSENGETWKEHDNSDENDTTLLNTSYDPQMSAAHSGRITRIITTTFPQYFAIITRIKQEVHVIGAEGGIVTSSVANDVQAVFPPGALTKKIKVRLQAHLIPAELTAKLLGNCVAVSPVITIEPRRRKFHKPISLTIPVPQAANKGMINQYGGGTPTLRLLCSIAGKENVPLTKTYSTLSLLIVWKMTEGGTNESQWEDVTGSTPLTFMNDTVSFTSTVSARFWLMDCRNIEAVPKMATELYEESLFVPYITNFVIYSKRMDVLEATLRVLCMTDGKEGMHTLERQEEFVEIVKSRDVEALDGKDLYIEFSGNLIPVTKSGAQLKFTFKAFRQNRLSFHVKVKDPLLDPVARMLFMREPKIAKGEPPQQPICVLNIVLPEMITKLEKQVKDSNIINQKLDTYESKYKKEHKEKRDEPKDTSPSETKFITDTLQKERTDAVTIHEFLAQKAACSLESVDASYPSKVVGQEQDLSPSVERQTYSEKRKFWEDISRKRESYQRSESEISRTSQLTVNESDSDYVQNVVTEDNTADMVQDMEKSETMEDLNVPDISECSVAEKAQYFEEQIQKEITKVPAKLQQQDSVKSDKDKPVKIQVEREEKYVIEKETVEVERKERKEEKEFVTEDEKEKDESRQVHEEASISEREVKKEGVKADKAEEGIQIQKEVSMPMREVKKEEIVETVKEVKKEKVVKAEIVDEKEKGKQIPKEKDIPKTELRKEEIVETKKVIVEEAEQKKKKISVPEEEKKVEIAGVGKLQERMEQKVPEQVKDVKAEKKEIKELIVDVAQESVKSAKEIADERKRLEETIEKMEEIKEKKPAPEISAKELKQEREKEVDESIERIKEVKARAEKEEKATVQEEMVVETEKEKEKKEDVTVKPKTIEEKHEAVKEPPVKKEVTETKLHEVTAEELKDIREPAGMEGDIMKKETQEAFADLIAQGRSETSEIKTLDVVQEKTSGKHVVTEETTIFYKVQEDGSLVQEQILKAIRVEGAADGEGATKVFEKSVTEGVHEIRTIGDVKPEDMKKEMQEFLELERKMGIEEAMSMKKEQLEKGDSDRKTVTEIEDKTKKESRIPISMAKMDKDKIQKETKPKGTKHALDKPDDKESDEQISPTTKKKEFESRIPKRVIDVKSAEKPGKKDTHIKKESEYTITEKKSSEEVTSKEEYLTRKSETQTFSKAFAESAPEAFKMFEDMDKTKSEFATVTSKVDHERSTMLEKKEVLSSEISSGKDKIITLEEKEQVEKKKLSESQLKKESPTETLEEKVSKSEESDKSAIQKMSMNLTETQEVIDASASEKRAEAKKEETFKKLSDEEGVTTREAGSTVLRESDAEVAIRIKKDVSGKDEDATRTVEGEPKTEKISKTRFADADIETLVQGESHKETKESFDVTQFVPSEKKAKEKKEPSTTEESLEEKQRQKFKEIEARTIAETLIQSIESEIEAKSAADLKAELLNKGYLEQIISESTETDHEKLADDLTRKFESIMKKSLDKEDKDRRLRSSMHEELQEMSSSARDSISVSEDITKDEESSPHGKEESYPLSSSQAKLQDRDITMSPSSISEQIDFEETIDVDINELESESKPTLSPQSEKQRSTKSSSQVELQRDLPSDISLPQDKIVSEASGARVLEILEPGLDSQSREDSVDVPSLEMDEHKISEQTSRGIPSLHESAATDSFERLAHERDITISPSTVSEDTNVDYSLVQESSLQRDRPPTIITRRADSFELESPPLISPKPKVRGLEIKPINWMIGDEKIEISETLEPSQIFNQELEAYEKKKERLSSLDGSTDHEQESGTKSSDDVSVIEPMREQAAEDVQGPVKSKFTVVRVSESDFENELVENKLEISCQELVDTLRREYEAKTPIKEYEETLREEISSQQAAESKEIEEEVFEKEEVSVTTDEPVGKDQKEGEEKKMEDEPKIDEVKKKGEVVSKLEMELKLEKTAKPEEEGEKLEQEAPETDRPARMDDVLKEWTETYLSKLKPSSEEYKRHMEKATEKHDKHDKPGRSTTVPSDTCAFKIKKDDHPSSVDLSARYAIIVLDQVVKKEIAEVKESLEAARQDLIEELSENSETVIQIKDSPSEFRFKLQPESIPNDLPFLYTPSYPEAETHEPEPTDEKRESPVDKSETRDVATESKTEADESSSSIEEPMRPSKEDAPVIKTEKSDEETAAITVQGDTRDDDDDHPSPLPASISGSDVDNKDESSSLALPRPVLRRRHKPGRSSKHPTSESDLDLGSSSGESSNYQSCEYETSSRPSSSDVEAMQSCGVPSGTASEYETAMMSFEHSSTSKPTSQEYHTAATTMSSRESMKSLTSLSSGHLGSIDSTSELSETLVPSEGEADKEELEENLNGALGEEQTDSSDSSGSEIPIDEPVDQIYSSSVPCRMKRSSEMIFPQAVDESGAEPESKQEPTKETKGVDFATSTSAVSPTALKSVDIMTARVSEDGVQSVCTQVISTQATETDLPEKIDSEALDVEMIEKESEEADLAAAEVESEVQKYTATGVTSESPEMSTQTTSIMQQASMSTSSTSAVSIDTVVGKEKSDRHSPDSDSFEMVDKPDIIDDFVVIEEVGREAEEYDSEGKSIRISAIPQVSGKQFDRDLENLIAEKKEDGQESTSQKSKNNELFEFECEESPPQISNDDQYSQSYSDDEQYEGGKKWMEMQFQADTRVYDIEYDRGPLEDIKEEEVTDFEAGSSRFGSLGSHKESIGSVGSMRGSLGSTPDYDVLAGKKYFSRPTDHDNVSLSSLQEFEHLESAVAAENSKKLQCGSHDSVNNGSLPKRYMASRSGHGDDISLSSLKDFEGLEKACREAHLIELRAREEEDLLEHESPENKYKLENLPRTRVDTSTTGSFNASTSGSDDYEKRIKEIDEIIRIAQSNVEKFDRQDDTTDDVSQIEVTDAGVAQAVQPVSKPEESELPLREGNIMETSTDSLELEDNMEQKHHPLCRSSDSLEMKTTLDFPSLSSDSLNNVRDAKEPQSDAAGHASDARRISSDSLDMPLLEQQGRASHDDDHSVTSDNSLEQRPEAEADKSDQARGPST
ncbi:ankyrin-2-like isoform X4 [Ceratina calcarata]|uniref:Ankyrin-2-like isoform X4 n=1 Tax=Ceratina calcarata TaxID=156304 RepID=A0AAJ7S3M3_9HYME|nr:ankyrin-2-like isoform X4 [Ceratina calcarata]